MKKNLNNIITIILIVIILLILFTRYYHKDKIIDFCGYRFLIVLTGSMEPEIQMGSLIVIKEADNYKIGDIVTYLEDDYFVTHRITEKEEKYFITKGDSNNENDKKISKDKILGKVVFCSLTMGKIIRLYLKYAIILFSIIIIMFNVICCLLERKKDEKIKNTKIE